MGSLWKLAQPLFETVQKPDNKDYPNTSYAGYIILPNQYFCLFFPIVWTDPPDVGESFVLPRTLVTETDQKTPYNKCMADSSK